MEEDREDRVGTTLIAQLAAVPMVGQDYRPYSVSPDGRRLAFQWYRDGDWQIFLKDLPDGGPRRLADIDDPCWCPQFSPDGRFLYFSRDDRGSECFDFYRYELATGRLDNLLPDTPDFSPLPDFALSPDGSRIAMTASNGPGYAVAVMPAAVCPGAAGLTHLSRHPYTETSPQWSPDGRMLAVTTGTRGQDTAIHVMAAGGGDVRIVGGGDEFHAGHLAWSPDGRRIALTGGPGDHPAVGLYDVATGVLSWVWDGPLDAHHPVWSPDGGALAFLVDSGVETGLCHLELRGGLVRELSLGQGTHYAPGFTPDGEALYVVHSGPGQPADLFQVRLPHGHAVRVTSSLPKEFAERDFASGVEVQYTSWDHLAEVPALLVEPDEPSGAGVVIIHGGPTWHHANEWDVLRQALAAAGVTVVHPNYRGSDGYGRRWQTANRWLMGQGEALDCAAAHRVPGGAGLRPGARRGHGSQLGRLPHHGHGHAVPRALGGGRRGRAVLRLHRLGARPRRARGPALVGPAEHGRSRQGRREARLLLPRQSPGPHHGAAAAARRRARPTLPAAAAARGGRGPTGARQGLRGRRLPG